MTSKMICPVCGAGEVLSFPDGTFACDSEYCKSYEETDTTAYNLLIQAKQDLEIARNALKEIKKVCDGCRWCDSNLYDPTPSDGRRIAETTNKALEQIEHKE